MREIRVIESELGPGRTVDWFCDCEGYGADSCVAVFDAPLLFDTHRNSVVIIRRGSGVTDTSCSRCGAPWRIVVEG